MFSNTSTLYAVLKHSQKIENNFVFRVYMHLLYGFTTFESEYCFSVDYRRLNKFCIDTARTSMFYLHTHTNDSVIPKKILVSHLCYSQKKIQNLKAKNCTQNKRVRVREKYITKLYWRNGTTTFS